MEDLREAYGNFSQDLRRKIWRLTEENFHKEGNFTGTGYGFNIFRESGFGNKMEYFYFKIRRTMHI